MWQRLCQSERTCGDSSPAVFGWCDSSLARAAVISIYECPGGAWRLHIASTVLPSSRVIPPPPWLPAEGVLDPLK